MSSQKKKHRQLPKLIGKSAQYTKESKTRMPERARNFIPRFHGNDLQDNSD